MRRIRATAAAFMGLALTVGAAAELGVAAPTSGGGKVEIIYEGKIGKGSATGHATFTAKGAIADSGTVLIHGRDTGRIVYTKLTFTGKKGTFYVSEKIIKGGVHTWTVTSGTSTYVGLHGKGVESGAPNFQTLHVRVDMIGTVSR